MASAVIFKNRIYTACAMADGSLVISKNKTQEGRRLIGENAAHWIDSIKTAVDNQEAAVLCKAMFS